MAHRLPQHAGHNSLSLTASITLGEYRLKQAGMLLFPSTLPPQDDTLVTIPLRHSFKEDLSMAQRPWASHYS